VVVLEKGPLTGVCVCVCYTVIYSRILVSSLMLVFEICFSSRFIHSFSDSFFSLVLKKLNPGQQNNNKIIQSENWSKLTRKVGGNLNKTKKTKSKPNTEFKRCLK